jgi:hypothetical protein
MQHSEGSGSIRVADRGEDQAVLQPLRHRRSATPCRRGPGRAPPAVTAAPLPFQETRPRPQQPYCVAGPQRALESPPALAGDARDPGSGLRDRTDWPAGFGLFSVRYGVRREHWARSPARPRRGCPSGPVSAKDCRPTAPVSAWGCGPAPGSIWVTPGTLVVMGMPTAACCKRTFERIPASAQGYEQVGVRSKPMQSPERSDRSIGKVHAWFFVAASVSVGCAHRVDAEGRRRWGCIIKAS